MSHAKNLSRIYIENNRLNSLSVKNGTNKYLTLWARGNENLKCIEVDDPVWSEEFWSSHVDSVATFSSSCETSVSNLIRQFSLYPNPCDGVIYFESDVDIEEIVVRNYSGLIVQTDIDFSQNKMRINAPDGLYFVTFRSGNSIETRKVVITAN